MLEHDFLADVRHNTSSGLEELIVLTKRPRSCLVKPLPAGMIRKIRTINLIYRLTNKTAILRKRPARTVKTPLITPTTPRRIVRIPIKIKQAPSWIIRKGYSVSRPAVDIINLSRIWVVTETISRKIYFPSRQRVG